MRNITVNSTLPGVLLGDEVQIPLRITFPVWRRKVKLSDPPRADGRGLHCFGPRRVVRYPITRRKVSRPE